MDLRGELHLLQRNPTATFVTLLRDRESQFIDEVLEAKSWPQSHCTVWRKQVSEKLLNESQCRCRTHGSTADVVFTEQLEEKCSKQHLDLVVALVELFKEPLGSILICSACTRRFVLH